MSFWCWKLQKRWSRREGCVNGTLEGHFRFRDPLATKPDRRNIALNTPITFDDGHEFDNAGLVDVSGCWRSSLEASSTHSRA